MAPDNLVAVAELGYGFAVNGNVKEGRRILSTLPSESKQRFVSPYDIAMIYAGLGERDHAFRLLETAVQDRSDLVIYLNVDPRLDSIRSEVRFANLVRRVGLPPRSSN